MTQAGAPRSNHNISPLGRPQWQSLSCQSHSFKNNELNVVAGDMAEEFDPENITPTQSQGEKVSGAKIIAEDAVFGEIQEGGVNYRDVSLERKKEGKDEFI